MTINFLSCNFVQVKRASALQGRELNIKENMKDYIEIMISKFIRNKITISLH